MYNNESGMPYFKYQNNSISNPFKCQNYDNPFCLKETKEETVKISNKVSNIVGIEQQKMSDQVRQRLIASLTKGLDQIDVQDKAARHAMISYFKNPETYIRNACTHCQNGVYVVDSLPDGIMKCPICDRKWTKKSSVKHLDMLLYLHDKCVRKELVIVKKKRNKGDECKQKVEQVRYYDFVGHIIGKQTEDLCMKIYKYMPDVIIVEKLNFDTLKVKTEVRCY